MAKLRKVVMTPYISDDEEEEDNVFTEQQGGNISEVLEQVTSDNTPKNKIKRYALDRQRKLLKIILRLATINGYDNQERIKLRNGSYLDKSDVVSLLLYTLSPGKKVVGLEEFVELLREAGVTSDMVINENVKAMLQSNRKTNRSTPPSVTVSNTVPKELTAKNMEWQVVANKRKRPEDFDDEDPKVEPITLRTVRPLHKAKRVRHQAPSTDTNEQVTIPKTIEPPPVYQPSDNRFRDRNSGWIGSSDEEEDSE